MKTLLLLLTACMLSVAPALRAEDGPKPGPKPAPPVRAEGGGDQGAKDPAAEALRKRFGEVRKQASEDATVKAALDTARAAMMDANAKLFAKMLEIDPSLAEMIDREKARMASRREGGGGGEGGRRERNEAGKPEPKPPGKESN